ncbi:MAG: tetratricopeptide repeat protein [Myxococcales bacterium]|nr:tetratricopeptide repeat protein [Myxococcales bacterium]
MRFSVPFTLALAAASLACGGVAAQEALLQPVAPQVTTGLDAIVGAYAGGDCAGVVDRSRQVREDLSGEIARVFHGDEVNADTARTWVEDHTSGDYPVLVVGEHAFEFAPWWSSLYGHCLLAEGEFGEAVSEYRRLVELDRSGESLGRLVLSLYWAGRHDEARAVLESWPEPLEKPPFLAAHEDDIRADTQVPVSVQHAAD